MDLEKRQTIFFIAAAAVLLAGLLICAVCIQIYRHSRPITVEPGLVSCIELEREVWDSGGRAYRREQVLLTGREDIDAFCAWWNRMDARRLSPDAVPRGARWFVLFQFQEGTQPAYQRATVRDSGMARVRQQNYSYRTELFPIGALWTAAAAGEPLPFPPEPRGFWEIGRYLVPAAAIMLAGGAGLVIRRRRTPRRR